MFHEVLIPSEQWHPIFLKTHTLTGSGEILLWKKRLIAISISISKMLPFYWECDMESCHKDQNRQIHRKQYLGPLYHVVKFGEQLMIAREYLSLDHIALLLKTTGRILA